jgi:hypothetical protein
MPYHRCSDCGLTGYSASAYSTASVCPNCSATLSDATRLYLTPGATHMVRRALASRPNAVGEARQEVAGLPIPHEARERLA